jgi:hypothetical protein
MHTNNDTVQYLLSDHLGSTSLEVSTNGTIVAENHLAKVKLAEGGMFPSWGNR